MDSTTGIASLCKYKDVLGKPNEGLHSYRFLNIAIFDVLGTILIAYALSFLFTYKYAFPIIALLLFLLGIILHWAFCVNTTVNKFLLNLTVPFR